MTTVIDHETQIVTQATTQTVTQPAVTVTAPAVTVTVPEVIGVPSPPPVTTPTGGGSPVALDFSGSGSLALRPFSLPIGETLSWTVTQDTFGSYGNFILDCGYANSWIGINALDAPNGSSYIPSGSYNSCSVIAENSWTIHIG